MKQSYLKIAPLSLFFIGLLALFGAIFCCQKLFKENLVLKSQLLNMSVKIDAYEASNNALLDQLNLCGTHERAVNEQFYSPVCDSFSTASVDSKQSVSQRYISERVEQEVLRKYAYLFQALAVGKQDSSTLVQLLAKREQLINSPVQSYFSEPNQIQKLVDEQQALLLEIDAQAQSLLGDESFSKYELLKDSGYEQFQLEQYNRSLAVGEKLSNEQKSQLLWSKLESKQLFEQNLAQLMSDSTTTNMSSVSTYEDQLQNIFDSYKNNYLADSAAVLTPTQFSRLKSLESIQWDAQYKSLKQQMLSNINSNWVKPPTEE